MKHPTVTSLFCGIGGLDLGFRKAGFNILWANDFSENAIKSYNQNSSDSAICADITQTPISQIPYADVIVGGPPCQSFSLMGMRRPNDKRGALVFKFFDIIKEKRPKAFLMENVPGMAASEINGKRLPFHLIAKFKKLGYKAVLLKLCATDYLVPQKRVRLFIVGTKNKNYDAPDPVRFAQECYQISRGDYDIGAKAAIGDLGKCVARGKQASYRCAPHSQFSTLMREKGLSSVSLHECPTMSETDKQLIQHIPPGGNYMDIPDAIAPGRVKKYKITGGRTTTYARLHPQKPSYTVNTYFRRPNVGSNFHYSAQRLITAREALRFQSFPDHFELVYDTQQERNTFIGNAVPPLMAHALAWQLKRVLD